MVALGRIPLPGKLDFTYPTLADDVSRWCEEFQLCSDLTLKGSSAASNISLDLGCGVFKTLTSAQNDITRTVTHLIAAVDTYCRPKKNEILKRFKFNMRVQGDESLETFITDLKALAMSCNFGELQDSLIRDRIVCGVKDARLREKLLITQDLSLDKAIETACAVEVTKQSVLWNHLQIKYIWLNLNARKSQLIKERYKNKPQIAKCVITVEKYMK